MKEFIKRVPIPTAGVALGLAALGNLLDPYVGAVRLLCGVLSLVLVVLVLSKACMFPVMIKEDFRNPILASVSATLFMAIMQLSGYLAPFAYLPAFIVWIAAIVAHLCLMIWFVFRFFRSFKLASVFPTYFICYVGIIVAALTSPIYDMETLGTVLFWVGFACYPILLVLISVRYIKYPVPDAARPLFCIYSAPASLSIAGYLAITETPNLIFVAVLLAFAQFCFISVLVKVPSFVKGGFFPSYAAMTFPFVITATALTLCIDLFAFEGLTLMCFEILCVIETVFAAVMVVFVLAHYLVFLSEPVRVAIKEYRTNATNMSEI